MEAHDRLDLLAIRADATNVDAAIDLVREHLAAGRMDAVDPAQFEEAAAELRQHVTMTAMVDRGWDLLRKRIVDSSVGEALSALDPVTARGASSGGDISAATFAFADGSFMILVDHGLATLTWLAAELASLTSCDPDDGLHSETPVEPAVAARAMRLGISRAAIGVAAGSVPSLVLRGSDAVLASVLVAEMDIFLLAHEAAHILLGHLQRGGEPFGAVGGTSRLVGKDAELEHAADLLAVTLLLDDALAGRALTRREQVTRIGAVHLFLAVLDLFESHTFVLQPTSHPAAGDRWNYLVNTALEGWFGDDFDDLLHVSSPLVDALAALHSNGDLEEDAAIVEAELSAVLDTAVWSGDRWRDLAKVNAALNMSGREAVENLISWEGWADADEAAARLGEIVETVLRSDETRTAIRAAVSGEAPLTKLAFLEDIEPVVDRERGATADDDGFPTWAVANLCADLIAQAHGRYTIGI